MQSPHGQLLQRQDMILLCPYGLHLSREWKRLAAPMKRKAASPQKLEWEHHSHCTRWLLLYRKDGKPFRWMLLSTHTVLEIDLNQGKNARRFPAMESSLRLGSWQRWRGTHHRRFRSTVRYCRERHRWRPRVKLGKRLVEMFSVCSSFKSPTSGGRNCSWLLANQDDVKLSDDQFLGKRFLRHCH